MINFEDNSNDNSLDGGGPTNNWCLGLSKEGASLQTCEEARSRRFSNKE